MKKLFIALFLAFVLILPAFAYSVPDDTIVYVTDHGEKYHREDCSYTSGSARPLTIEKAEAKGYSPCSRCNPDRRTGKYVSSWDGESDGSGGGSSRSDSDSEISHASSGSSVGTAKKKSFGDILSLAVVLLIGVPYILWVVIALGSIGIEAVRDFFRGKRK